MKWHNRAIIGYADIIKTEYWEIGGANSATIGRWKEMRPPQRLHLSEVTTNASGLALADIDSLHSLSLVKSTFPLAIIVPGALRDVSKMLAQRLPDLCCSGVPTACSFLVEDPSLSEDEIKSGVFQTNS